jgi:hypothetical protein
MTQTILSSFAINSIRHVLIHGLPAFAGIVLATGGSSVAAFAQTPTCAPPSSKEFLLLVVSKTPETQAKVRNLLSRDADVKVCNYFGETVTRVGGFRDQETAMSWANYLNGTVGLQAFVARPSQSANVPQTPVPPTAPPVTVATANPSTSNAPSRNFNPQRLGEGFAVIVNYYNRPELATSVQQALNRQIGLVAYQQRAYLLAVHTRDRKTADVFLRRLNDRGFNATIVDSRRTVLLTPAVNLTQAVGRQ